MQVCVRRVTFHGALRFDAPTARFLHVTFSSSALISLAQHETRHLPSPRAMKDSVVYSVSCSLSCAAQRSAAPPVAGAVLPQCELYEKRSRVTLSHWWLPYLDRSAAQVPGVRTWQGWLSSH